MFHGMQAITSVEGEVEEYDGEDVNVVLPVLNEVKLLFGVSSR